MMNKIKKLFTLPDIEGDEDTKYEALIINSMLWMISSFTLLALVARITLQIQTSSIIINVVQLIIWVSLFVPLRQGKIRLTGTLLLVMTFILLNVQAYISGGLHRPIIYVNLVALALATLFSNRRVVWFAGLAIVAVVIMYLLDGVFLPTPNTPLAPIVSLISFVLIILFTALILQFAANNLRKALARAQNSEIELSRRNKELQTYQQTLETQVDERTRELSNRSTELELANKYIQRRSDQFEALAQVAQTIALIRDLQELLLNVTTVISEKYGFYHVGIFLNDDVNEYAAFAATNSAGGKKMLERKHRLKIGEQGIVGSVTSSGIPRIALDVGADAVFFNNPDLPDTHSEMALPLRAGEKIIGALDVQSTESDAFTDEDVQTLSLLAEQVSLAIENARLFEESKKALDELKTISRQSTREAWSKLPEKQNLLGYRYNAMGASPLKELVKLEESGTGKVKAKGSETGSYVVPIELRGEVIGSLVVQSPTGRNWNEDERDLIKAVAERVALSAENARLFDETTQRADRERLVTDITSKIRSHDNPQAMIETAINELREALGATKVKIIQQSTDGKDSEV